ncbi:hypothetical protein CC79DRAFT_1320128 [Sarocladium strictum]
MDKIIDGRFERLEKALAGLIDSVTKYHPSVNLARELELADEELTKGLEQVQTHQNNYLRIQKLRETSNALDTQIRDTLSSLATTRKDIVTTHTTTYPAGPNYTINYDELLSYARRISKTTLPPSSTINSLPPQPASGEQTPAPDSQPQSALTPNAPTPSQTQSPAVNGVSQPGSAQPTQQTTGATSLPEQYNQFLNPLSGQIFFPWPTEDKIRGGALASNQMLTEQGIDPKGYDPAAEEQRKAKEEEDRKAQEEKEKVEREEAERKRFEEREKLRKEREAQRQKEQEEWRRGSAAAPPSAISPTTSGGQFQFASMDDDDD